MEVGQGNGQQNVNSVAPDSMRETSSDAPDTFFASSPSAGHPTVQFADTPGVHSVPEPPVANVVDVLGQSSLKEADKIEIPNLTDAAKFRRLQFGKQLQVHRKIHSSLSNGSEKLKPLT